MVRSSSKGIVLLVLTYFGSEVNHTALGRTTLPQTLTTLLKDALKDSDITSLPHPAAIFELLRIGANLCMDHGEIHCVYVCSEADSSQTRIVDIF